MSSLEKDILRFLSGVGYAGSSEIAAVLQQSVSQRVLVDRLQLTGQIF